MQWDSCYTHNRVGINSQTKDVRSQFQRDYDRLIFSSAFRRLQSKTQVFPLPGSTFVHNRLTHSLEVSSVGRSLGSIVGNHMSERFETSNKVAHEFYKFDLANIIAAGCLAHDIGNPAFGHSGEDAISNYFTSSEDVQFEGQSLRSYFNDLEWHDLINFEGNANALRVLAQSFQGKAEGGLGLSLTTLASIFKYPCNSSQIDKRFKHRKKYSYFQSEKGIFQQIVDGLSFHEDADCGGAYKRHPFVYLVEAADDICYRIVDMEDAHRLGIITQEEIESLFFGLIKEVNRKGEDMDRNYKIYRGLADANAAVSFLRAKCIKALVLESADIFVENSDQILAGEYSSTLVDEIEERSQSLQKIQDRSIEKIYNHDSVVEIEIAGYNVMSEILSMYIPAVLKTNRSAFDKQVLKLLPAQHSDYKNESSPYLKVMGVLDHVSAMTDIYATDFYRKVKGIEISKHRS